jgi:hypothetical protein
VSTIGVFNLFSLALMQMKGWLSHGDNKKTWLKKGKETIMFDIVVPTPKGVVFCMHYNRHAEMMNACKH